MGPVGDADDFLIFIGLGGFDDGVALSSDEGCLKEKIWVKATPNIPVYSKVKIARFPQGSQITSVMLSACPTIHRMLKPPQQMIKIVVCGTTVELGFGTSTANYSIHTLVMVLLTSRARVVWAIRFPRLNLAITMPPTTQKITVSVARTTM
jgi:hypothetical protein